jgi:peptidylprolyl isomerase
MADVRPGDAVRVHLTGRLANGAVFGTSEGGEPVRFVAASGQMIEGLVQAVLAMQAGEKMTVAVPPERGFGPRQPELQARVPRSALPPGAQVGDRLTAGAGGQQMVIWVRELGDESAVVDGNHPLAGQDLVLDVELVSIEPG